MARPKKVGLEYFSLDTTWDTSMRLLKAKFGLEGVGCIVELYKMIYQEGYYSQWDNDAKLLFSNEHHISIEKLNAIVSEATARGIFDEGVLKAYHVITSRGIQKRWAHIMSQLKRTAASIEPRFDLVSVKMLPPGETETGFIPEEILVSSEETSKKMELSTQRKGKEKKENKKEIVVTKPEDTESKKLGADAHDLFMSYYDKYKSSYGVAPSIPGGKAIGLLKTVLKTVGKEELQDVMEFAWKDDYIVKAGHGLALLLNEVSIGKARAAKSKEADLSRLNT